MFSPSLGWPSGTEQLKGPGPSPRIPPMVWPASLVWPALLPGTSCQRQEPLPRCCVTFRSRAHSLFFILFSSKGSDIPVSQFGSLVAVLSQARRAGDIVHRLKWSLRDVCGVSRSAPYPSFPTPARGAASRAYWVSGTGRDPVMCVVVSNNSHPGL